MSNFQSCLSYLDASLFSLSMMALFEKRENRPWLLSETPSERLSAPLNRRYDSESVVCRALVFLQSLRFFPTLHGTFYGQEEEFGSFCVSFSAFAAFSSASLLAFLVMHRTSTPGPRSPRGISSKRADERHVFLQLAFSFRRFLPSFLPFSHFPQKKLWCCD